MADVYVERISGEYLREVAATSLELLADLEAPQQLEVFKQPGQDHLGILMVKYPGAKFKGGNPLKEKNSQVVVRANGRIISTEDHSMVTAEYSLPKDLQNNPLIKRFDSYSETLANKVWMDQLQNPTSTSDSLRIPVSHVKFGKEGVVLTLVQQRAQADISAVIQQVLDKDIGKLQQCARLAAAHYDFSSTEIDFSDLDNVIRFVISYTLCADVPGMYEDVPAGLRRLVREIGSFEPLLTEHRTSIFNVASLRIGHRGAIHGLEQVKDDWSFDRMYKPES